VGLSDSCAPSRTGNVYSDLPGLASFLANGWVVAATDYAGLGTQGTEEYLVGSAEAHDVLNSVRSARALTGAGSRFAVFGHSQGGNSALFTAQIAASYAPELELVGVVAAAPAAALVPLIAHQWQGLWGSLISSEVLDTWPASYPGLSISAVSARSAVEVQRIASRCVEVGAADLAIGGALGASPVLSRNPDALPSWHRAFVANTPQPSSVPTLVVQGTADPIVLPGSTAAWVATACAAGAPIQADYIGTLGHLKAGFAAAPSASTWLQQRFAGHAMASSCGTISPVPPLS
jgi:pimeloyl-ACP methyl ester carboxylesterase